MLLPELSECFAANGSNDVSLLWSGVASNCALLQELWSIGFQRGCAYCPPHLSTMWRVGTGECALLSRVPFSSARICRSALSPLRHGDASWRAVLPHLQPPTDIPIAVSQPSIVDAAGPVWHW
jgi:hypothetical protein